MSIFKISLIDPPIDAFDGGMSYFGIIWMFKKIPYDGGGVTLKMLFSQKLLIFFNCNKKIPDSYTENEVLYFSRID